MTVTTSRSQAHPDRAPLVRRTLTRERGDGFEVVEWSERSVKITRADGRVAFAMDDVEAPVGWSNLAVAVVAPAIAGRSKPGLRRSDRAA